MPKQLYEVVIKTFKVLYVEAESAEAALESEYVTDESDANWHTDVQWEHDETDAREITGDDEKLTRKLRAGRIKAV